MDCNISVVIPAKPSDVPAAKLLAEKLPWASEVCIDTSNGGAARAKNHGCQVTKGDIVLFLDSDLADILGDPSPICDDMESDYWVPVAWDRKPEVKDFYSKLCVSAINSFGNRFRLPWGPAMAVRRKPFLEQGGFNERATCEDVDYALHALERHWQGYRGGLMPVTAVVGRRLTYMWKYLIPGKHASSKFRQKEPSAFSAILYTQPAFNK